MDTYTVELTEKQRLAVLDLLWQQITYPRPDTEDSRKELQEMCEILRKIAGYEL